jgi:hypothetical protein
VIGIVSENPGIVMDDELKDGVVVALLGKVPCKVDAGYGEIKPGDLLVASSTKGHAMKIKPIGEINGYPIYPQGCMVGKALEPQKEGKGKIMVLVTLM